jgi:hypothetical protein
MKKILFIAFAAVCCFAMAMPAAADIKISGLITNDVFWYKNSAERNQGGVLAGAPVTENDTTHFQLTSYRPMNYIDIRYTSKDGNYGGHYRLRMGNDNTSGNNTSDPSDLYFSTIWWKPNPGMKLEIGRQPMIVGGLAPASYLGTGTAGTIVHINWGNLHSSNYMGLVMDAKINDWAGIKFGIYDPDDDGTPSHALLDTYGNAAKEEIKWPRFDIAFPLKFGNFKLTPKGTWCTRTYEDLRVNQEDSLDQWAASIDMELNFGPLQIRGEYSQAQNLADGAAYSGGSFVASQQYVDGSGVTRITDTDLDLWWLQLGYKFTKKLSVNVNYGNYQAENEVNPTTPADNYDIERQAYVIFMQYNLFPNLLICPEYSHWDYGDSNKQGAATPNTTRDDGTQDIWGVAVRLLW